MSVYEDLLLIGLGVRGDGCANGWVLVSVWVCMWAEGHVTVI